LQSCSFSILSLKPEIWSLISEVWC